MEQYQLLNKWPVSWLIKFKQNLQCFYCCISTSYYARNIHNQDSPNKICLAVYTLNLLIELYSIVIYFQTYCMLSNCSRTTFHSSRAFGTNKYKEAKKRRRREDMSWVAPLLERHENPPQIPEEPAKLHMVELVKTTKGRPYWEKRSLQSLGMGEKPKVTVFT